MTGGDRTAGQIVNNPGSDLLKYPEYRRVPSKAAQSVFMNTFCGCFIWLIYFPVI